MQSIGYQYFVPSNLKVERGKNMKERFLGVFLLILLVLGAFNASQTFAVSISFPARNSEYSPVKSGDNKLEANGFPPNSTLNFSANEEKTEVNSRSPPLNNFNYTEDAKKLTEFAYYHKNKTRIVIGVNNGEILDLDRLENLALIYNAEIVDNVVMKNKTIAVVVELEISLASSFIQEVKNQGLVSYVQPNMKYKTQFLPNDPYWPLQWGPQKIEADWAWNYTTGAPSILVAVVDTGIDYTHEDIAENYVPLGYDWVNMDSDPLDDFGHGTHCAGIIAAVINNSVGISGMAQIQLMAEKVLDSDGYGYDDWIANGIIHATEAGADIISLSIGGYGESQILYEAIRYAYENGVLLVAAAGNDNTNIKLYPAGYDEVIAVTATDQYDNKAYFSNYGEWVELAAPGVDIYSTMPSYYVTMNGWGYSMYYEYMSGTSMAAPHVAGLAALLWSYYQEKSRDWVRLWLRHIADDLGVPGFDEYYGYGRINARKAFELTPPEHDLIAYQWQTPLYVEPQATSIINGTILNFGSNNETGITVKLFVNSTEVDSEVVDFLATGKMANVTFFWSPAQEGLYNVTFYVVPVYGETDLENNILEKYIYVGHPLKAVVLHSAGNVFSEIITNWDVLNSEWYKFGSVMCV